jgi:glycosyltransferase involved in cell wall biosynthesis
VTRVLYLTQDGITDHIGQAQIAPYLLGLAEKGHAIHIVSAEKPGRDAAKASFERRFSEAGIDWTQVRYANRPPLISSFLTMALMWRAARRVADRERPDLIHCRSYLPLELAARLKARTGAAYLADFRDFWADVGIETKRFKFVFRWFRRREAAALAPADHVVTLTDRAADMLIARHPHVAGGTKDNYTTIPCCADFDLFDPSHVDENRVRALRETLDLPEGTTTLLYLGSLGPDYLLDEMLSLFRELRALKPDAAFLFLINNGREAVEQAAAAAGLPADAFRFASAPREEIPVYASIATLSAVFIRPTPSKAGCSPTKLGELFAMNVPIIANTGFGDIDAVVDLERNGSVLVSDFRPETLRGALSRLLDRTRSHRPDIRSASGAFSLEEGVRRYDRIYSRFGSQGAVSVREEGSQGDA